MHSQEGSHAVSPIPEKHFLLKQVSKINEREYSSEEVCKDELLGKKIDISSFLTLKDAQPDHKQDLN